MDTTNTNFQTSFIPKKPLAEDRIPAQKHTSIFAFLATLVFIASLAGAAGMYFYTASLKKNIASMNTQLQAARDSFEPSLITQLHQLDQRISAANELLTNHISVSPVFAALEANTLKSVQFTKFSYATPNDPNSPVTIDMSGVARDYASIALESDQLAQNKNIHNSIFSNLVLDEKTGTVSFDLVFTVDADLVHFVDHLDDLIATPDAATTGTPAATGTTTPAAGQPQQGTATTTLPSAPQGTPVTGQ